MIKLSVLLANVADFPPDWLEKMSLSASSQQRLAQLSQPHRRVQFMLGRWLMAQAAGCSPEEVAEGAHFPCFAEQAQWQASISHSGDYVAVLVSHGFRCGLDIEQPQRQRDWPALAERAFSRKETCWIAEAPPAEQCERFQRIWTLREAAFKAGLVPGVVGEKVMFDPATGTGPQDLCWQYLHQGNLHVSAVASQPFQLNIRPIRPPHT